MKTPLLLGGLLVLAACSAATRSGATGDVRLDVAPNPASADGTVRLTLANHSDGTVGYNLCTSAFERGDGATWTPLRTDRVCTMELRTLTAGGTTTYSIDAPDAPGRYRAFTVVERMGSGQRARVVSHTFEVRG